MLIVGCGDIGMRVVGVLRGRVQLMVLTSTGDRTDALHAQGVRVLRGDLDQPRSLRRIAGLATRVLHLAPPAAEGWADTRTRDLVAALRRRTPPLSLVYGSTSGVYGDCAGALIAETRMTRSSA
jgi:nucleoside-diphosphate-sugar epimerase